MMGTRQEPVAVLGIGARATGWRPARCAPASRRSAGTAGQRQPGTSPGSARRSPRPLAGRCPVRRARSAHVRLALQAADGDRFAAFACLAGEWQQGVDQGLGDQDLTVVTRMLQRQGQAR
jgi:hypothetical protein